MALNFLRFYYYSEEILLQNEIIRNVLNDENAPDMWEIESNADLLLINAYETLNNIRPSVPTTVYLGGIHQKLEKVPLSAQLTEFLDDSERVVYVNLNSAIQQDSERFEKLLKALEKTQVDIVWSLDGDYVNSSARIFQGFNFDQESLLGECHFLKTLKKL
jgi:hypothetical protein